MSRLVDTNAYSSFESVWLVSLCLVVDFVPRPIKRLVHGVSEAILSTMPRRTDPESSRCTIRHIESEITGGDLVFKSFWDALNICAS